MSSSLMSTWDLCSSCLVVPYRHVTTRHEIQLTIKPISIFIYHSEIFHDLTIDKLGYSSGCVEYIVVIVFL